ncbi:MAG: Lrp/AsnC ligand binding domain-containing protein, partial [Pseudomonadota bacterium]
FIDAARSIPEVIEIQTFLGRVDVRLSVIAKDMTDYQRLYREAILTLPHIADIEALMHVARLKTNETLPL